MIALDTETTGLLRPGATELWLQPFMIEIYIAKFDKDFVIYEEFNQLVKPPVPVSEEITKITGITNEMLEYEPSFIEIYRDLCEFVKGEDTVFAHNATFDMDVIKTDLDRHNLVTKFPWPMNQICTVEASMPIKNRRLTLAKLYEMATGKKIVDAHRAKNDVLPMVECIEWLFGQELIIL